MYRNEYIDTNTHLIMPSLQRKQLPHKFYPNIHDIAYDLNMSDNKASK